MLRSSSGGSSSSGIAGVISTPQFPRFTAKYATAQGAAGTRVRVGIVSDSTGVGGVNPDVGWPYLLANGFLNSGTAIGNHGSSMSGIFSVDTQRISIGSSWTTDSSIYVYGNTYKASTTTNSLSFTPAMPADKCRVWYIRQPSGGILSIGNSGVGVTNVDTAGTLGLTYYDWNNGTTVWSSAFDVKYVSGGQVNVVGFETWNTNRGSVDFINTSLGATGVDDWSSTTSVYSWLNALVAMDFDLVIMAPGVNSMPGTSLTDYQTQIETMVAALKAASTDLIMLTPVPQNPADGTHNNSVATQDSYVAINRLIAAGNNIPLVDVYDQWGSYTAMNAYGYYVDTWVHPTVKGHAMIANMVQEMLSYGLGEGNYINQDAKFANVDLTKQLKLLGSTFLSAPNGSSVSIGQGTAMHTSTGPWNIAIGNSLGALTSGFGFTAVGYQAGNVAGGAGKQYGTYLGQQAGLVHTGNYSTFVGSTAGSGFTSGDRITVIGRNIGVAASRTGSRVILAGSGGNTVETPAAGTSDYLNIENMIDGVTQQGTGPGLRIVGAISQIGVLKGANFNSTADQAITIAIPAGATKYIITNIMVTNASANLTTAVGGFYTAASKGGTTLVANTQVYTSCSTATGVQRVTLATGAADNTYTATTQYLSLTTGQGSTATADVYVFGIPLA